jgi:hypothetical protein
VPKDQLKQFFYGFAVPDEASLKQSSLHSYAGKIRIQSNSDRDQALPTNGTVNWPSPIEICRDKQSAH